MNKFLTLLLLAVATSAFAQYSAHYEKKALTSFYSKDFESALLFSEKVIEVDPQNVSSLYVAGESARMMEDLDKAESYLEKIPDEAKIGYYAMADYRLGSVKHDLAKTDEAEVYYEKYLTHHGEADDLYAHLASQALGDLKAGEKGRKDELVELERLGDNINSELSEMAPLRYADKLYFTTVLEDNYVKKNKHSKKMVQRPVTRIYEAQFNRPARPVDVNPSKASVNASNVALTPDAKRMYYTICKDSDYNTQEKCQIWYRNRTYEGDWGPAVRLPEHINVRGYSATQPSIGYDQNLKRFVLYFTSDRPGGKGGMDIWASPLDWMQENFGEPYPLEINTEGDEVTPFYHQSSQTLFFSSNGLPTEGGLDIFRVKKDQSGEWETPETLGEMLNSEFDDLYYTFHTSTHNAYFVSDRPGSNCGDEKGRGLDCTDIYQARIFVDLELDFFSTFGKMEVMGAQLEMEDLKTGATGSLTASEQDNQLRVRLEPGHDYKFTVHANGYHPKTFSLSTEGISFITTLEKEVLLENLHVARP